MSSPDIASSSVYFPQFGRLPIEIRIMIWECCMPLPRVVDLQHRNVPTTTTVKCAVSKTPVPTVLLVSRESFDSASRFYERTFISTLSFSGNHYTVPKIWFSFERDTLYIPGSELCTGIHLFTWHMPRLSHGNLDAGGYHRVANLALPSS